MQSTNNNFWVSRDEFIDFSLSHGIVYLDYRACDDYRVGGDGNESETLNWSGVCVSDWSFYRGRADGFYVTFVPYRPAACPDVRRA
jgi:hypothetical protein